MKEQIELRLESTSPNVVSQVLFPLPQAWEGGQREADYLQQVCENRSYPTLACWQWSWNTQTQTTCKVVVFSFVVLSSSPWFNKYSRVDIKSIVCFRGISFWPVFTYCGWELRGLHASKVNPVPSYKSATIWGAVQHMSPQALGYA